MKYLYLIIFLAVTFTATAQKNTTKSNGSIDESIHTIVDNKPTYKGGQESLNKYFQSKLVYPEEAKKNNTTGIVHIEFIVSKNGRIENAKVLKGIGSGVIMLRWN